MDKFCNKCQSVKPSIEFYKNKALKDGLTIYCKTCCNLTSEKYRSPKKEKLIVDYSSITEKHCNICNTTKSLENFGKRKDKKDGFQHSCKSCCEIKHKLWRDKNKDKRSKWNENWRTNNPERAKESVKNWEKNNPEKVKENQKKYYEKNPEIYQQKLEKLKEREKNNPEKYKEIRNKWKNERKKNDILFKLSSNMRTRLSIFYKKSGLIKKQKTNEIIGCSWEELHNHIKSQFVEGMSYENYGKWHIDHIIPLVSAKNEEELKKLCNYKNLQPLWAEDNLRKGDKIL